MNRADTAVLMSVYRNDDADHFEAAMQSLLDQHHRSFHARLMVDGPVGPKLAQRIERLRCRDPERVLVTWADINCGLASSLNHLIEEAMACRDYEFFARMDADDVADPGRLAKQVAFLRERQEVDVVGTFCNEMDREGRHILVKELPTSDAALKAKMLLRCPFIHPTVVFRRRVFAEGARYRTDSHLTEDMFLWVDLAKRGHVFANIPEPLLNYRVTPDFYRRRRGLKKAVSEYRAKRYVAGELGVRGPSAMAAPLAAFMLRVLPESLLKVCYEHLR